MLMMMAQMGLGEGSHSLSEYVRINTKEAFKTHTNHSTIAIDTILPSEGCMPTPKLMFFIVPRYNWGPYYGSQCQSVTEAAKLQFMVWGSRGSRGSGAPGAPETLKLPVDRRSEMVCKRQ